MNAEAAGGVRELRRSLGLTQRELAGRSGLSLRALRDVERGTVLRPRPGTVRLLARGLGVAPQHLHHLLEARPGPTPDAPPPTGPGPWPAPRGLSVGILGPLSLHHDGVAVPLVPASQRTLLALLALHAGRVIGQEEIGDCLWPGDRRVEANRVHALTSRLRRALPSVAPVVLSGPDGYRLDVAAVELDVDRFDRLVDRAREAARQGPAEPAHDLARRAVRLWRGPVLAGERDQVRSHPLARAVAQRRLPAVLLSADLALAAGDGEAAVAVLRPLLEEEPLHEGLHARLVRALAATGAQAEALRLYGTVRDRLDRELGIEPSPELRAAHLAVLRQQSPAAPPPPGAPVAPPPVPVAVPQVPAQTPGQVPAQLPADVPGFVGRAEALGQLDELLEDAGAGRVPVAVVRGMAGVGKTALAVHWAQRVSHRFPDGQLFLDLRGYDAAEALEPLAALASLLQALGVAPKEVPTRPDDAAALYRSVLAGRRVLVVLDNAGRAAQVRPLLPGSDGCFVVVTSRDAVTGLVAGQGARLIRLGSLDAQESEQLLSAVLGAERVRADAEGASALVRACAGLPLALRIAAANLTEQPAGGLRAHVHRLVTGDRLADLAIDGDEASSVRGAFERSYRRLPPAAAGMFPLLSVLPGTRFSAAQAAAVAGLDGPDGARVLERLAGAHLVERRGDWFGLHDLLRLYAEELTAGQGQRRVDAATDRLNGWYFAGADAASALLYPHSSRFPRRNVPAPARGTAPALPDRSAALRWLRDHIGGLLTAAGRAAGPDSGQWCWLLVDAVWSYLWDQVRPAEWAGAVAAAVRAAEEAGDPLAQAGMRRLLAVQHHERGDAGTAVRHATASARLAEASGWTVGHAAALSCLGTIEMARSRHAPSRAHTGAALELYRGLGHRGGEANMLNNLATVAYRTGRFADQVEHATRAVSLYSQLGFGLGEANTRQGLAEGYRLLGDLVAARAQAEAALRVVRDSGHARLEVSILRGLAAILRDEGRADEALALAQDALRLAREWGTPRLQAEVLDVLGGIRLGQGAPGDATAAHRRALQLCDGSGNRYEAAVALIGLAAADPDPAVAGTIAARARAIARRSGLRALEGQALTVSAEIELAAGAPAAALRRGQAALVLHRRCGAVPGQLRTALVLSRAWAATGRPGLAERYRRRAQA